MNAGVLKVVNLGMMATLVINFGIASSALGSFFAVDAERRGVNSTVVGIMYGCFTLALLVGTMFSGKLVNHLGLDFMIGAGVFMSGGSTVIMGALDNSPPGLPFISLVIACRFIDGFGVSMFLSAAYVIAGTIYPKNISLTYAVLETAGSMGSVIGPIAGGSLYDNGGFSLPFYIFGSVMVIIGLIIMTVFETTNKLIPEFKSLNNSPGNQQQPPPPPPPPSPQQQRQQRSQSIQLTSTPIIHVPSSAPNTPRDSLQPLPEHPTPNPTLISLPSSPRNSLWLIRPIQAVTISWIDFFRYSINSWVLLLSIILQSMSVSLTLPSLSVYLITLGLTNQTDVGLILLAASLGYAVSSMIFGFVTDRASNHSYLMMASGSIISTVAFLLTGPTPPLRSYIVPSITGTAVANGFCSIGFSLISAPIPQKLKTSMKLVGFPDDPATTGFIAAMTNGVSYVGIFIGPIVGGVLIDYFSFPLTTSIAAGITGFIALLTIFGEVMERLNIGQCHQPNENRSSRSGSQAVTVATTPV